MDKLNAPSVMFLIDLSPRTFLHLKLNVPLIVEPVSSETDKDPIFVEDYLYGEISKSYKGNNGFGYDPIFYVPNLDKNLAELTLEEKNKISHRALCLKQLIKYLK